MTLLKYLSGMRSRLILLRLRGAASENNGYGLWLLPKIKQNYIRFLILRVYFFENNGLEHFEGFPNYKI